MYQKAEDKEEKLLQAELILQQVKKIRTNHRRVGTRKLHKMLEPFLITHKIKLGRDALFDLLGEFGLLVKPLKRNYCTTNSYHRFYKYPNLIKDFKPAAPNKLWVSDITYIEVKEKFMYLSVITDAFSHKIVGSYLSKDYSTQGPLKALKMALAGNKNIEGLIHHSDRGVQYCSSEYTRLLRNKSVQISMTENGDPYENGIAERVNGIVKTEYLEKRYSEPQAAVSDVKKTVRLYNTERLHMSIGLMTPDVTHRTGVARESMWKRTKKENINL